MGDGDDNDSLTGVWHGQYSYPSAAIAPVAFVATLIDSAGALSGSTHETAEMITGGKETLYGAIEGKRSGRTVRFVKTYIPADEAWGDILYEGTLSPGGDEIEGEWVILDHLSGRFLMIRQRGAAQTAEKAERATA